MKKKKKGGWNCHDYEEVGGFVFPKAAQNLRNDFVRSNRKKNGASKIHESQPLKQDRRHTVTVAGNHQKRQRNHLSVFLSDLSLFLEPSVLSLSRNGLGAAMEAELKLERERAMGDCKRVAVMAAANNAGCMSKRRRIAGSPERLRPSASLSDLGDRRLWLENARSSLSRLESNNSLGVVAGDVMCAPVSCSSCNDGGKATAKDALKFEDLEVNFEFLIEVSSVLRLSWPWPFPIVLI